jgi:lipopolysaccharide export system protein LptC
VPRRGHIPRPFCSAGAAAYDRGLIPRLDRGAKRLTAATAAERSEGWTASSRSDLSQAFRVARRHSRRVRVLRIAIPTLVVLLVLGFAAATWFNPLRIVAKLPNGAGTLTISGTKITMELPRIAGYTRDARAYELSAQSADQDLTRPDNVELKGIAAKVELQNNAFVEMTAASGLYNTKAEQLRLGESILLKSSNGYEARLTDALIDMRSGQIVSDQPVEVKLLNGVLNARRLEVAESGALMRFSGGVAMTLNLNREAVTGSVGASSP